MVPATRCTTVHIIRGALLYVIKARPLRREVRRYIPEPAVQWVPYLAGVRRHPRGARLLQLLTVVICLELWSRRYHNFNLYCAGFGPFLAAAACLLRLVGDIRHAAAVVHKVLGQEIEPSAPVTSSQRARDTNMRLPNGACEGRSISRWRF